MLLLEPEYKSTSSFCLTFSHLFIHEDFVPHPTATNLCRERGRVMCKSDSLSCLPFPMTMTFVDRLRWIE